MSGSDIVPEAATGVPVDVVPSAPQDALKAPPGRLGCDGHAQPWRVQGDQPDAVRRGQGRLGALVRQHVRRPLQLRHARAHRGRHVRVRLRRAVFEACSCILV